MTFQKQVQQCRCYCSAARRWLEGKTLEEAWQTCERGDWMVFAISWDDPRKDKVLTLLERRFGNDPKFSKADEVVQLKMRANYMRKIFPTTEGIIFKHMEELESTK